MQFLFPSFCFFDEKIDRLACQRISHAGFEFTVVGDVVIQL